MSGLYGIAKVFSWSAFLVLLFFGRRKTARAGHALSVTPTEAVQQHAIARSVDHERTGAPSNVLVFLMSKRRRTNVFVVFVSAENNAEKLQGRLRRAISRVHPSTSHVSSFHSASSSVFLQPRYDSPRVPGAGSLRNAAIRDDQSIQFHRLRKLSLILHLRFRSCCFDRTLVRRPVTLDDGRTFDLSYDDGGGGDGIASKKTNQKSGFFPGFGHSEETSSAADDGRPVEAEFRDKK